MTDQPKLTGNASAGESGKTQHSSARRDKRQRVTIPGVDEILQRLIQLNGAVAIGAISTRDANLIHKNLKTVLEVQMKRASGEGAGPSQEALSKLCRDDPRLLSAIEPFLTDSQVDLLMKEVTDEEHETI